MKASGECGGSGREGFGGVEKERRQRGHRPSGKSSGREGFDLREGATVERASAFGKEELLPPGGHLMSARALCGRMEEERRWATAAAERKRSGGGQRRGDGQRGGGGDAM